MICQKVGVQTATCRLPYSKTQLDASLLFCFLFARVQSELEILEPSRDRRKGKKGKKEKISADPPDHH